VGRRYVASFRHIKVASERRPAKRTQIELHHLMLGDSYSCSYTAGALELPSMALPIIERQRVGKEALILSDRQNCSGIQAAAEEDDGTFRRHKPILADAVSLTSSYFRAWILQLHRGRQL